MALNAGKDGGDAPSAHVRIERGQHQPPMSANTPSTRFLASAATPQTATTPNLPAGPSGSLTSGNKDRPLTVPGLLKANANAPDPVAAALEQAVSDRNNLAAQNSQLWKLIEKQRTGYNQLLKELERVRSERDAYRGKASGSNGGSDKRGQKSNEGDKVTKPRSNNENVNGKVNGKESSHPASDGRHPMTRHHSDDHGSRSAQHANIHSSRSHEPFPTQERGRSASIPDTSMISSDSRPRAVPPPPTSTSSAVTGSLEFENFNVPRSFKPSPTPLIVPPRPETLPVPASAVSATQETNPFGNQVQGSEARPINPRKESLPEGFIQQTQGPLVASPPNVANDSQAGKYPTPTSTHPPGPGLTPQTAPPGFSVSESKSVHRAATQPEIQAYPINQTPIIRTASLDSAQSAASPSNTQSNNMLGVIPEGRAHMLSRDSRISLPDEAKRYIANMTESPGSSPKVDAFAAGNASTTSLPQQPSVSSPLNPNGLVPPPTSDRGGDSPGASSEFLDLNEDDEGSEADDEESAVTGPDGDELDDEPEVNQAVQSHSTLDFQSSQEEFLPYAEPPFKPVRPMIQVQAPSLGHTDSESSLPPYDDPAKAPPLTNPYSPPGQSEPQSQPFRYDVKQPTYQPVAQSVPANFRALPLLSSDLPHTNVSVSHSFVRPNDRGKEVLSFIVHVTPGNGKEGWKVEKMYSDVLALDQRVRNSVGKGVGKKIANLPEGRLWKDHAPAKVDQRKAVLEGYLQSLINLPVKNNDEVIAFFTSDIVRETKQPVMQAGHKEGYLTKRGKNFGGWKTRYFVLSGPVLEYYDCRGGAHLGSIHITGAQIGRQQRTERPPGTDDEKEYRHAFLIVEARKGPGGNHPRHVLCAESDEDRDSWVEMLVRYFSGTYSEEPLAKFGPGPIAINPAAYQNAAQPRSSTSSNDSPVSRRPQRGLSKDDIAISKGPAVPISQLPQDENTAKFFQQGSYGYEEHPRSSSPSRAIDPSPTERHPNGGAMDAHYSARRLMERGGQPSSLPDSSPLSNAANFTSESLAASNQRANSELGHYPDLQQNAKANRQPSPERHRRDAHDGRKSFHPSLNPVAQSPTVVGNTERSSTPDKLDASGKVKISGPMNAAPIPSGFKFGGKDAPSASEPTPSDQRREKARSRFWNWKSNVPDKSQTVAVAAVSRAVFGVPLDEALDVAQIANLPAIVFRCVQYLEAKKADQEEGIYRLSGSSAVIKSLKDRFNSEGDVDLLASDEYWDPHAISGLLKSFLRELPASILTRDLHLRFLSVIDFVDAQERIKELSRLIAALPIANYSLLRALTAHLILIVQNSGVNKMTMRNVGIVFSPTLGIPAGVFSLMLGEFNRVFNVGTETGEPPAEDTDDDENVDRRNSRQYSDAAADQMLGLAGRSLKNPDEVVSESDEVSMQDESGAETTDGDLPGDSSSESPHITSSPPDTPVIPKSSKASHAAATKGLNVITNDRGNRHSKIMGLPHSPRPPHSPNRQSESR